MNRLLVPMCILLCGMPAWAKDPGQAVADMQAASDVDPNGFKWMIVCIGLLFLMAGSLIVGTVVYGMKVKKGKE